MAKKKAAKKAVAKKAKKTSAAVPIKKAGKATATATPTTVSAALPTEELMHRNCVIRKETRATMQTGSALPANTHMYHARARRGQNSAPFSDPTIEGLKRKIDAYIDGDDGR